MGRRRGVQYQPGSFWRTDDRTGFATRAGETRQEWDGAIVGDRYWEPRQPQDFVKGVPDQQSVPNPRSEAPALWDGPIATNLTEDCEIGEQFLPLVSVYGFTIGDRIGVMLDNGEVFNTTIVVDLSTPTTTGVTIQGGLPYKASAGNDVTDYEAPGP